MLFQTSNATIFIIWLILATFIVALIIYIAVWIIESKYKASDKKFLIFLIAFIVVLILPLILVVFALVLGAIGDFLAGARNLIEDGGENFLILLVPIFGFIILLLLLKWLIDITWESSLWISLLTLFVLYIIYSLIPELYTFMGLTL